MSRRSWLLTQLESFLGHYLSPLPCVLLWWFKTCANPPSWRHLATPAHALTVPTENNLHAGRVKCRCMQSSQSARSDRKSDKSLPATVLRVWMSNYLNFETVNWQKLIACHPSNQISTLTQQRTDFHIGSVFKLFTSSLNDHSLV